MILREYTFSGLSPPISIANIPRHRYKHGYTARMIQSQPQRVVQTHQSGHHPSSHAMEQCLVYEIPIHLNIAMGAVGLLAMKQINITCPYSVEEGANSCMKHVWNATDLGFPLAKLPAEQINHIFWRCFV